MIIFLDKGLIDLFIGDDRDIQETAVAAYVRVCMSYVSRRGLPHLLPRLPSTIGPTISRWSACSGHLSPTVISR